MMRVTVSIAIAPLLVSCSPLNRDRSRLAPSGSAVDAVFDASFDRIWARTRVRAYADVQGKVSSRSSEGEHYREGAWGDCTSTGEIERRILDTIQERLANG